jgi:hypothetical protein
MGIQMSVGIQTLKKIMPFGIHNIVVLINIQKRQKVPFVSGIGDGIFSEMDGV